MALLEALIGLGVAVGGRKPRRVPRVPHEQLKDTYEVFFDAQQASRQRHLLHLAHMRGEPAPTLSEGTIYEYPADTQPTQPLPVIVV